MKNRIKTILYIGIGIAFIVVLMLAKALRADYPLFSYGFALLMVIGYVIYLIRRKRLKQHKN